MVRSAIAYNRSISSADRTKPTVCQADKSLVRICQKSFFENFKIKTFLDDSWILLVIPDNKSSPQCGHVAMKWFRKRNVFVLVRNCQKPKEQREQSQACLSYAESRLRKTKSIVRNLSEIFFVVCRKGMWRGVTLHIPFFDTLLVTCNQKVVSKTLPCK